MSKRIFNSAQTIAIELAGHRPLDCSTGRDRLVENRIGVFDVQMDTHRRSTQALGTSHVHPWKFIG
jgi:hypothetical protein